MMIGCFALASGAIDGARQAETCANTARRAPSGSRRQICWWKRRTRKFGTKGLQIASDDLDLGEWKDHLPALIEKFLLTAKDPIFEMPR